jgi:acetoin utilization protein AcuB
VAESRAPASRKTASETLDLASLEKRAHQIMSRELIALRVDGGMREAIGLLNRNRISCIPIVDAQSRTVGMVGWREVLWAIRSRRPH